MATVQTQIRIDEDIKREATELLEGLGLNLSSAVNMFLNQVVLREGIPFDVSYPQYNSETITAMREARKISRDPNAKSYSSFSEMMEDLDNKV